MRPTDLGRRDLEPEEQAPADCPFCAGNESLTPPELHREWNEGSWAVRVVTNKYAALRAYTEVDRRTNGGLFERLNGHGAHEVVIETPHHSKRMQDLPVEQVRRVIDAYIARLVALQKDPSHRYVQLFKNHGKEAGASLQHPHTQIVATPIVPPEVRNALNIARAYYERKKRCLYCDLMLAEIRSSERLVEEDDGYVVWAPYASRFPFELVLCPRAHSHDFTQLDDDQRWGLARMLRRTLMRLTLLLGDIPYNLVLETSPNASPRAGKPEYWKTLPEDYHWRIAILPRLTRVAGFEWGTGLHINPMPPEKAAGYLREVDLRDA